MVPEHPGRERPLADDEPRVHRRTRELGAHHPSEHEVPDGAAAVPALKPLLALDQRRLGRRVVALESFQPRDPGVAVPLLAPTLSTVEMRPQLLRVGLDEAQRAQPAEALVSVHVSSRRKGLQPHRDRPQGSEAERAAAHAGRRDDRTRAQASLSRPRFAGACDPG